MKRSFASLWYVVPVLLLAFFAYMVGKVQANAPLQGGEPIRWYVVTNPSDASKTFLIDSVVGDTYILSSRRDTYLWNRMKRLK